MVPPRTTQNSQRAAESAEGGNHDRGAPSTAGPSGDTPQEMRAMVSTLVQGLLETFKIQVNQAIVAEVEALRTTTRESLNDVGNRLARRISGLENRPVPGAELGEAVTTLRSEVNQLLESKAELATEVDLRFSRMADRLNELEVPGSYLTPKREHTSDRKSKVRRNKKITTSDSEHDKGRYEDPSSDEDRRSQPSSSSDEEDNHFRSRRDTRNRKSKGAKYPGLKELSPTNSLYKDALSYRSYRLEDTSQRRTSRETGKVRDYIKRMDIKLKQHHFTGEDPIMVLDFLARFVREANIQEMSEAQAFLALPHFLDGFAKSQYEAGVELVKPRLGGVSSWPESVQYLLRNYAQSGHISSAISDLRAIQQDSSETERQFATRMNKALSRCGNVHSPDEIITWYVDGLHPTIRTVVARYRESHRHATYLDLVDFAQHEGDAVRARNQGIPVRSRNAPMTTAPKGRSLALLHPMDDSHSSSTSNLEHAQGLSLETDPVALLQGQGVPLPHDDSSTVPSESVDDPLLAFNGSRGTQVARPSRIAFEDHHTRASRPGWAAPRKEVPRTTQPDRLRNYLICHECYARGHVSPDCNLPLRSQSQVIANFEKLSDEDKLKVPSNSYRRVRATLGLDTNAPGGSPATGPLPESGQSESPPGPHVPLVPTPPKSEN